MLRYKTKTRPGLVALYDIRPGNGAGPFLQPRSPHGAAGREREGREREKGSEGIGEEERGKENRDRPPTIFGLKVALAGAEIARGRKQVETFLNVFLKNHHK